MNYEKRRRACEKNGNSKLTKQEVDLIRAFMKRHPATTKTSSPHHGSRLFIARWFGISPPAVSYIIKENTWLT